DAGETPQARPIAQARAKRAVRQKRVMKSPVMSCCWFVGHASTKRGTCLHARLRNDGALWRVGNDDMKLDWIIYATVLLAASHAAAQEGGKAIPKTTISLGTATPGGGFPVYGNAFAEVMNAADPSMAIEPRTTKGSNENIPLLEAAQLDIALVAGEPAYE